MGMAVLQCFWLQLKGAKKRQDAANGLPHSSSLKTSTAEQKTSRLLRNRNRNGPLPCTKYGKIWPVPKGSPTDTAFGILAETIGLDGPKHWPLDHSRNEMLAVEHFAVPLLSSVGFQLTPEKLQVSQWCRSQHVGWTQQRHNVPSCLEQYQLVQCIGPKHKDPNVILSFPEQSICCFREASLRQKRLSTSTHANHKAKEVDPGGHLETEPRTATAKDEDEELRLGSRPQRSG